ncbi:hypothetical protein D3C71_914800 [compost metagenome]
MRYVKQDVLLGRSRACVRNTAISSTVKILGDQVKISKAYSIKAALFLVRDFFGMLENWISVYQFGATLSFVIGAYSSHRYPREQEHESKIARALCDIEDLRKFTQAAEDYPSLPQDQKLNKAGWQMSVSDLNDYRREVTDRYYQMVGEFHERDRLRQRMLWLNGFVCLFLLVVASSLPGTEISLPAALVIALPLIGIPIACILTVWQEDNILTRELTPSNNKRTRDRMSKKSQRSDPAPHQTYHVFNHIRRVAKSARAEAAKKDETLPT